MYSRTGQVNVFKSGLQGVNQKFWEDVVFKNLGKMGALAPNAAGFHGALCVLWCCEPLLGIQGRSPKSFHYLKVFEA